MKGRSGLLGIHQSDLTKSANFYVPDTCQKDRTATIQITQKFINIESLAREAAGSPKNPAIKCLFRWMIFAYVIFILNLTWWILLISNHTSFKFSESAYEFLVDSFCPF